MNKILIENKNYVLYEYIEEEEFERDVVKCKKELFGKNAIYIDVKKKIGDSIISIPDGYLIDFTFSNSPRLYMIENELSVHDAYKHIGQQLLRFAISYKESGRKIKDFLLKAIEESNENFTKITNYLKEKTYRNLDDFLEQIIFNTPVSAIVVIDQITDELDNVLKEIVMKTDIVELKKYYNEKQCIFEYTPFHSEVLDNNHIDSIELNDLDTIVVPANKEGFEDVFIRENCWYAIRISTAMIDKIKYIAGYQTAPVSAITYIAEVDKIEKYKDTNKYIVYFKDKARKINPVKLVEKGKVKAPQAPRYTIYNKLINAENLDDAF